MSKKILPIMQPSITSWAWQAGTFAILEAHNLGQEWLYSNYIQLTGNSFSNTVNIDFYPRADVFSICPLFCDQKITRSLLKKLQPDFLAFVKSCIDLNNYVYAVLDLSAILHVEHFYHDLIIYGYDDGKEQIYLTEFVFKLKYSFETISYNQFIQAYSSLTSDKDYMNDMQGGVQLISIKPSCRFDFDTHIVKEYLREYINSSETENRYRVLRNPNMGEVYGISVYDLLIRLCLEKKYDARPFSVLRDHKALMVKRLSFMQDEGFIKPCSDLINEFHELTKLLNIIISKEIKYHFRQDDSYLDYILNKLEYMKKYEKSLFEKIDDRIIEHVPYAVFKDPRD